MNGAIAWVTWAEDVNLVTNLEIIVNAMGVGTNELRINLTLSSFTKSDEINKESKVKEHVMAEHENAGRNTREREL